MRIYEILFKHCVLNARNTIRNNEKRDDKEFIFNYLTISLASNLEIEVLEYFLAKHLLLVVLRLIRKLRLD